MIPQLQERICKLEARCEDLERNNSQLGRNLDQLRQQIGVERETEQPCEPCGTAQSKNLNYTGR